ncbi:MAG: class I SAM-dependent methyltransferase [Anaerolineales bacterium]
MVEYPQVWHYGLVARWWAEFNSEGPEIEYFMDLIKRYGDPALDVACGTGRLLIPFLRAGLEVDGCDISADMIVLCTQKAQTEGFSPQLYRQAMHELALPRKYKTIVVCGSIYRTNSSPIYPNLFTLIPTYLSDQLLQVS